MSVLIHNNKEKKISNHLFNLLISKLYKNYQKDNQKHQ